MIKMIRLAVVLAVSLAAVVGTSSLASAAPAPTPTPKQQQAACIVQKSIELLKAIDKQTWTDKKARDAAVRAIPAQVKKACGTTPPSQPPSQPVPYDVQVAFHPVRSSEMFNLTCMAGDKIARVTVFNSGGALVVGQPSFNISQDGQSVSGAFMVDPATTSENNPDATVTVIANCEPSSTA